MRIFTYSEARQKLAALLDIALADGKVLIRRRDGSLFALTPAPSSGSPLDVPSISTDITTKEIVAIVREGRRRGGRKRRK